MYSVRWIAPSPIELHETLMVGSHLHVKLSRKSHAINFHDMEWDMAT